MNVFSSGEDQMRNYLIRVNGIEEVNKHWLKGVLEFTRVIYFDLNKFNFDFF